MRRVFLTVLFALAMLPALAAERPDFLLRVERLADSDRETLLSEGLDVAAELGPCLLVRGGGDLVATLEGQGRSVTILDASPTLWDYYIVGLRPDSDLALLNEAGTVLHTEENWVLLRLPARASFPPRFSEAKVFVGPVSRKPLARARLPRSPEPPIRRPAGPRAAVPLVQKMVDSVDTADIDAYWGALVGTSGTWLTRYSTAAGCTSAANYVLSQFQSMGLAAQNISHTSGHAPNTEGEITGAVNPAVIYLVEGHLDDMPSSGTAPGADDNASGSVVVLEAANVLSCYAFKNTVRFLTVTGEEFGLYGSEAYAAAAGAADEDIRGVINMDMPGWAGDGLPSTGENLDLNYDGNSAALATFYAQCATDYATGLSVNAFLCPGLNASDHYPFWQEGYAAICGITDNEGYCDQEGHYPYYHTINDTLANCGTRTFFYNVNKTTIAALAELGEPFKILLDQDAYGCSGTAQILVGDRDLNASSTTVQTVQVSVWSTAEPTPETVTLTEDGVNSMLFRGTVTLSATAPVHGDGVLSIAAGSTLTASYTDALDCDGATNVTYTDSATACSPALAYDSNSFADACAGTGSGGDGTIDAGEDVTLQMVLRNTGTAPLTAVSATISSSTTGVTISDGSATFPDIAVGATGASQANHFSFRVGSSVVCGTALEFAVHMVSAENPSGWDDAFTLTAGLVTPGTSTPIDEAFATGDPPAGWTRVNGGTGNQQWTTTNPGARTAPSGMTAPFEIIDSDYDGSGQTQDDSLITPAFSCAGATAVTLEFDTFYNDYDSSDFAYIDVSDDNGATWTTHTTWTADVGSATTASHQTLNIAALAGTAAQVKVRFRYVGAYGWYWMVDNVKVTVTAPGGCAMTACTGGCTAPPAVVNHRIEKSGADMTLAWDRLDGVPVDRYEVWRATALTLPPPADPAVDFTVKVGETTGLVSGFMVTVPDQPANAYYLVRAVTGACDGPLN